MDNKYNSLLYYRKELPMDVAFADEFHFLCVLHFKSPYGTDFCEYTDLYGGNMDCSRKKKRNIQK